MIKYVLWCIVLHPLQGIYNSFCNSPNTYFVSFQPPHLWFLKEHPLQIIICQKIFFFKSHFVNITHFQNIWLVVGPLYYAWARCGNCNMKGKYVCGYRILQLADKCSYNIIFFFKFSYKLAEVCIFQGVIEIMSSFYKTVCRTFKDIWNTSGSVYS